MDYWNKIRSIHKKYWENVLSEYYNQESSEYKHLTNEDIKDINKILNKLK